MIEDYNLLCPGCNTQSLTVSHTEYEVEHFGSALLSVLTCTRCGYRHSDIMMLTRKDPVALTALVNSREDLNMRVIKSGTATIVIPEFGATITPGPYSEGYISNIEGILQRLDDALVFMLSSAKGRKLRKGEDILKQIRNARETKPHFTLIIKDPLGNSAIVSSNTKKLRTRKLTKRELASTKFGQYVLAQ
jgi:zinc finger protein